MNKFFSAVIILFLTGLAAGQDKGLRKEIEAIYAMRQKAMLDKDFARLKSDWADDYTEKNEQGVTRNRQRSDAALDRASAIIKNVPAYSIQVAAIRQDANYQVIVDTVEISEMRLIESGDNTYSVSEEQRHRDTWIRANGKLKLKCHQELEATVLAIKNEGAALSSDAEWKYVGSYYDEEDNEVRVFYAPQSRKRTPEGFVQIWIKQKGVYENDAARKKDHNELLENRRLSGFPLKGYEKYAFSTTLLEFDCPKRQERLPCVRDYDESGQVIGEECRRNRPFKTVPQHTIEGLPFEPVAKQQVVLDTLNAACNDK